MTRANARLSRSLLFLSLGLVAIYAPLLPLGNAADGPGRPDLVFALTAAWILRRPASAPLAAVLPLGLIADLVLSRPLGLGALGLVLAGELLRANRTLVQGRFFPVEWIAVSALFVLMLAAMALALRIVFAEGPGLVALSGHAAATALAYPIVVVLLHFGLGLRGARRDPGFGRLA